MTQADFTTVYPLTFLVVWACILLLVDLLIPKEKAGTDALQDVQTDV